MDKVLLAPSAIACLVQAEQPGGEGEADRGRKNNIRAQSYEDAKRAVSFISSYAEDNALVLPGRVPGFKQEDMKLLPSSETRIKVYWSYRSTCDQLGTF